MNPTTLLIWWPAGQRNPILSSTDGRRHATAQAGRGSDVQNDAGPDCGDPVLRSPIREDKAPAADGFVHRFLDREHAEGACGVTFAHISAHSPLNNR